MAQKTDTPQILPKNLTDLLPKLEPAPGTPQVPGLPQMPDIPQVPGVPQVTIPNPNYAPPLGQEPTQEVSRRIERAKTDIGAFVGLSAQRPIGRAMLVRSATEFHRHYGVAGQQSELHWAVTHFFNNGGREAWIAAVPQLTDLTESALRALDSAAHFNLLCIPDAAALNPEAATALYVAAGDYVTGRRAMLITDIPPDVDTTVRMKAWISANAPIRRANSVVHFPRVISSGNSLGSSGAIAGMLARSDREQGVWKSAAGANGRLLGIGGLTHAVSQMDNDALSRSGVNCLIRTQMGGYTVWGNRTLMGADWLNSDWKYIPVRRTALMIEESIRNGTEWAVSDPGDNVCAQVEQSISDFLFELFRDGAFPGRRPEDCYTVRCDASATGDGGTRRLDMVIMIALLRSGEFLPLRISQPARP
ncbi:MAG: phage tail sheath subtilisin-like domain-containing protein [Alphaproteobacteria bacterium]|nr:phage tail sheath subtilisin-like domain-containing protein [Alphaproteobacteria bacterium]